jgi:hypothetical protein
MGGKRPDQYNIDPREAGATDYKNLPETGHGRGSVDDTVQQDRRQVAQSQHDVEMNAPGTARGVPIPGAHPAPSKFANAPVQGAASGGSRRPEETAEERRRESQGTEDPRDRGVGA